jgi:hypothetical protein
MADMIQKMLLLAGWAAILAITLWATATMGLAGAATTFLGDLGHPWRLQFYADLELHLLVVAAWIVWRERSLALGILAAAAAILLGALFTFPYLLVASLRAGGDVRKLLLGGQGAQLGR